jgi:hypothetical protein
MPPALYPTLREVFLERVIRIEAVQCERAAAMEESRQPGAPASTEDVELFFDHGIFPGVSARPRRPRNPLWLISTAEPSKPPPKLTALERGLLAALRAWHQLVRELRNGTLVATGERFEWPHPAAVDRQEIDRGTWLDDTLWFDVRDNRICVEPSGEIRRWFNIRVRGANEAAEFDDSNPDATVSVSDTPPVSKRRRGPSEKTKLRQELFEAAVSSKISDIKPSTSTPQLQSRCGAPDNPTQAWRKACGAKSVDPVDCPPPSRTTINRWLGRRTK